MGVWIFLIVCILACLLIIFFDVYAVLTFKRDEINYFRYYKEIMSTVLLYLEDVEHEQGFNEERQKTLLRKLRNPIYLAAFVSVIKYLKDQSPDNVQIYLCDNFEIAYRITKIYCKRNDRQKAFFAHVIFQMYENRICESEERSENSKYVIDKLILFMQNPSIYVRENSFKALVKISKIDDILRALRVLNYSERFQNDVLIENNLKITNNNHNELVSRLMQDFDTFNEQIKLGIIKYFLELKDKNIDQSKNYPRLFQIMCDKNTSKSILYILIQYFSVFYYSEAKDFMIETLSNSNDNTARSLSAFTLQTYPSDDTGKVLVDNLKDENWYVRTSCASTLASYGTEYDSVIVGYEYLDYKDLLLYFKNVNGLKMKDQVN